MRDRRHHDAPFIPASPVFEQCTLVARIVTCDSTSRHRRHHPRVAPPGRQLDGESAFGGRVELAGGLAIAGGRKFGAGVAVRVWISRATLAGDLLVKGAEDGNSGAEQADEEFG